MAPSPFNNPTNCCRISVRTGDRFKEKTQIALILKQPHNPHNSNKQNVNFEASEGGFTVIWHRYLIVL